MSGLQNDPELWAIQTYHILDSYPQYQTLWEVIQDEELWASKQYLRNLEELKMSPCKELPKKYKKAPGLYFIKPEHFSSNRRQIKKLPMPQNLFKFGQTTQELPRRINDYGKNSKVIALWTIPENFWGLPDLKERLINLENRIFSYIHQQPFFQRFTTDHYHPREYFYLDESAFNLKRIIDNFFNNFLAQFPH